MPSMATLLVSCSDQLSSELSQLLTHQFNWTVNRTAVAADLKVQLAESTPSVIFVDLHREPPDDEVLVLLDDYLRGGESLVQVICVYRDSIPRQWAVLMDHYAVGWLEAPVELRRLSNLVRETIANERFNKAPPAMINTPPTARRQVSGSPKYRTPQAAAITTWLIRITPPSVAGR